MTDKTDALLALIEALARADAEDYLREQANGGAAGGDPEENHALPATGEAA